MVTKIDRCSRNTLEFLTLQDILFKKNITFVALDLPTSIDLATNKLIATTLSGGQPIYVPKYRTAPKVVDQGLGAGANPAGAGGGGGDAEFDDQCTVPKNQQSQSPLTPR